MYQNHLECLKKWSLSLFPILIYIATGGRLHVFKNLPSDSDVCSASGPCAWGMGIAGRQAAINPTGGALVSELLVREVRSEVAHTEGSWGVAWIGASGSSLNILCILKGVRIAWIYFL